MRLQILLDIYIGFESPFIIRHFKPVIDNVFIAHFADCHFNKTIFHPLGREKSLFKELCEIT